jgi:hypothetical protein
MHPSVYIDGPHQIHQSFSLCRHFCRQQTIINIKHDEDRTILPAQNPQGRVGIRLLKPSGPQTPSNACSKRVGPVSAHTVPATPQDPFIAYRQVLCPGRGAHFDDLLLKLPIQKCCQCIKLPEHQVFVCTHCQDHAHCLV